MVESDNELKSDPKVDKVIADQADAYLEQDAAHEQIQNKKPKWRFTKLLDNKYINVLIVLILIATLLWILTKISFLFKPLGDFLQIVSLPIIFAAIAYYLSVPLVNRLERKGYNRTIGTIAVFVIIVLLIVALGSLIPIIISQGQDFINDWTSIWSAYQTEVNTWFGSNWYSNLQGILNDFIADFEIPSPSSFTEIMNTTLDSIGSILGTVTRVVVAMVTSPIILFYMLRDGQKLPDFLLKFVPIRIRKQTNALFTSMNTQISSYVRGQIVVAVAVSIMFVIGYLIIGLPYGVIIGILAGFLNIIPYLGSFLAMIPAIIVAIVSGPAMIIQVLIVFAIEQTIESRIISPQILGNNLKIHPITIMLLLLAGADLLGIAGIILIIPIYAVLKVVFTYFFEWYSSISGLYEEKVDQPTNSHKDDLNISTDPISHSGEDIDQEFHQKNK